jgi:mRNA interferase RelE/StbE
VNYTLRILPRAEKQLARLNSPQYDSIKAKILDLSSTPRPAGCKKLRGRQGWRIRVGDYRVVYEIDDVAKAVTVLKIGHRSEIYQ